jgi:hypothetical protein
LVVGAALDLRPTFEQMHQYVADQQPDLTIYTLLADFNNLLEGFE